MPPKRTDRSKSKATIPGTLDGLVIDPAITLVDAMAQLDKAGSGALAVCTGNRKLVGILTDGDIRRAILRGVPMSTRCSEIINTSPIVSSRALSPNEALQQMATEDIDHLPIVNEAGELLDFLLRKSLSTEEISHEGADQRLDLVVIPPTLTITEAISRLDKAGTGALVLCSDGRKVDGILSDGDIRRAILRGVSLDAPCQSIANANPITAKQDISRNDALQLMLKRDINHLPLVDANGEMFQFLLRKELSYERQTKMSAVIMAGGFGTRLLPLTKKTPKPMLRVGDRPLLERTIERLRRSGIHDISLTTHYLSENIEEHFGSGENFGVRLSYSQENDPLGTAGGLKLLPRPEAPFVVINGDILTGVSFDEMLRYHHRHRAQLTVGVRKYDVNVPFGVVECDDIRITELREKPTYALFINAGIYLLEPNACDYIPDGIRFDMTDLIKRMLELGKTVVSFPIIEYWLDVGRHEDYAKAQEDFRNS